MAYAITRMGSKFHVGEGGRLGGVQAHNERSMTVPHANPDDQANNIRLVGSGDLLADVNARLPEKMRSNAVIAVELLYTASPEYFRPDEPEAAGTWREDRLASWREATTAYLAEHYGANLVAAYLHLDEATPHIHAVVVPLDGGKLNARDLFNKAALQDNHTAYAKACADLGLERGREGSKAKHRAVKEHYRDVNSMATAAKDLPRLKTSRPKPSEPKPPLPGRLSSPQKREEYEAWAAQRDRDFEQLSAHCGELKAIAMAAVEAVRKNQALATEAQRLKIELEDARTVAARAQSQMAEIRDAGRLLTPAEQLAAVSQANEEKRLEIERQRAERAAQAERQAKEFAAMREAAGRSRDERVAAIDGPRSVPATPAKNEWQQTMEKGKSKGLERDDGGMER